MIKKNSSIIKMKLKKFYKKYRDWENEEVILTIGSRFIVTNNVTIEFFILIFMLILSLVSLIKYF
jgi:hypothetical protein